MWFVTSSIKNNVFLLFPVFQKIIVERDNSEKCALYKRNHPLLSSCQKQELVYVVSLSNPSGSRMINISLHNTTKINKLGYLTRRHKQVLKAKTVLKTEKNIAVVTKI